MYNLYIARQAITTDNSALSYLSNPGVNAWFSWGLYVELGISFIVFVFGLAQLIDIPGLLIGKSYSYRLTLFLPIAIAIINFSLAGLYASAPIELGLNSEIGAPLALAIFQGLFLAPIFWYYIRKPHVKAFLGVSNTSLKTSIPIPIETQMPTVTSIPIVDHSSLPIPPSEEPKQFLSEEPKQIGSCPKCHCEDTKVIDSSIDWLLFKCQHCGFVFAQKKAFPYSYLKVVHK